MAKKLSVLLDSSVIISGLNSKTGASWAILELAKQEVIKAVTCPYILEETKLVLKRKFPNLVLSLEDLLIDNVFHIIDDPSLLEVNRVVKIISDPNDAAILAAAKITKVDFLITLDKRHFLIDPLVSQKSQIKIIIPGKFMNKINDR